MHIFISGIGLLAVFAFMIYILSPETRLVKTVVKIENQFNINFIQHKTIY